MQEGYIIYQGSALKSSEYFNSLTNQKISTYTNPADILIKNITISHPPTPEDEANISKFR